MKKKHHHFTAQHEDRREQGTEEESGDSGMVLPIVERREGQEGGQRERGRRLRSDTPCDDVGDPGQKGLDKSIRSYLGKREEERVAREREREEERGSE